MLVGAEAEVLNSLTGVLGAAEQQGVAAGRGAESQLVEGQCLTTGGKNAGTGGGGKSQSGDGNLGDREEAVVVGDGTNNNDDLALILLRDLALDARKGDGGSVDAGHEKAAKDDLVEVRVRSAYMIE